MLIASFKPDGTSLSTSAIHSIYHIRMSSGESYALDLAGAQYGWHGPAITPWPTFAKERIDTILETCELGETANGLVAELQGLGSDYVHHHWMTEFMRDCFNGGLAEWQRVNIPLSALLRASEDHFQAGTSLLLEFMKWCMDGIKARVNEKSAATGRIFQ